MLELVGDAFRQGYRYGIGVGLRPSLRFGQTSIECGTIVNGYLHQSLLVSSVNISRLCCVYLFKENL